MAVRSVLIGAAWSLALAGSAAGQDEAWRNVSFAWRDFGWDTAVVGDLNGDGWREVLIGAPDQWGYNGNGFVLGLDGRTGATLFTIHGFETTFGESVAGLGADVDGDGVEEFLVSGDSTVPYPREVVLYSGADQTPIRAGAMVGNLESVADLDGDGLRDFAVGWVPIANVYSSATFAQLRSFPGSDWYYSDSLAVLDDLNGDSLAVLDDLNGDSVPDLAIGDGGAYGHRGAVVVWSLKDGKKLGELKGGSPHDRFGDTVVALGDLDGDGVGDFAIGSIVDSRQFPFGQVATFSGRTRALLHELRHERGERPLTLRGGAGDFDGDGFQDYLVHYDVEDPVRRYDRGATWVVSGKTGRPFVNLSSLDLLEADLSDLECVAGADVDGDGFSDVVYTHREWDRCTAGLLRGGPRFLSAWHQRVLQDEGGDSQRAGGGPPPPPAPGGDGSIDACTWLVAAGFAPATPLTLVLVAVDGVALNLPVVQTLADADGRWADRYPDLLAADHVFELQAVGLDGGGNVVTTPIERVAYRVR